MSPHQHVDRIDLQQRDLIEDRRQVTAVVPFSRFTGGVFVRRKKTLGGERNAPRLLDTQVDFAAHRVAQRRLGSITRAGYTDTSVSVSRMLDAVRSCVVIARHGWNHRLSVIGRFFFIHKFRFIILNAFL